MKSMFELMKEIKTSPYKAGMPESTVGDVLDWIEKEYDKTRMIPPILINHNELIAWAKLFDRQIAKIKAMTVEEFIDWRHK